MKSILGGLAALALFAGPASAAIILDGTYDVAYGAAKSSVAYDPAAPLGNFGTPGPTNQSAAYDIYLTTDATTVYGLIRADRVTGLQFANLYFDLDPANGNGSDLGFEITNDRAFVPGMAGYSASLSGLTYALSADGLGIEFAIDNSLFTSAIAGLTYYPGQEFATAGTDVVLRLSQSFGYSVAGGASYGIGRLGSVTLGASSDVPAPASLALAVIGLGMLGFTRRRRPVAARS
jgi:MYXO-CTERM domain-containing protein